MDHLFLHTSTDPESNPAPKWMDIPDPPDASGDVSPELPTTSVPCSSSSHISVPPDRYDPVN